MGEWDYYCALCGGPFSNYIFLEHLQELANGDVIRPRGVPIDIPADEEDQWIVEHDHANDDEDELTNYIDEELIRGEHLTWLNDMRLIVDDEETTNLKRSDNFAR
jgi:hypothetical protein